MSNQDTEFLAFLHQLPISEQGAWFSRWTSPDIDSSETQRGMMIERIAVEAMIYSKRNNQMNFEL